MNSPGQNIPSQTVFTCLSHDIIAHEMTHAIVHRLARRISLEPSNVDVLAFHEGILRHRGVVSAVLLSRAPRRAHPGLGRRAAEIENARGAGSSSSVRRWALERGFARPSTRSRIRESWQRHTRRTSAGRSCWPRFSPGTSRRSRTARRTSCALRQAAPASCRAAVSIRISSIASPPTAAQLSDRFLRMCFRAFDYMPPVDVTFGDFLRALVTSDFELNPADPGEVRFETIEAFRERGIYPSGVQSLAEEALLWPSQINGVPARLPDQILAMARDLLTLSAEGLDQARVATRHKRSRVNQPASLQSGSA